MATDGADLVFAGAASYLLTMGIFIFAICLDLCFN